MSKEKKIRKRRIKYSEKVHKMAPHIAKARSAASEDAYAEGKKGYRENEEEISEQGVTAELIARDFYKKEVKDGVVTFTPMVDFEPIAGPDGAFGDCQFDVKSVADSNYVNQRLFINKDAFHNENKKVDAYVYFKSDKSSCVDGVCEGIQYIVSATHISQWEEGHNSKNGSSYYYIDSTDENTEEIE